ncbi:LLM class flavin-dependent oxidoreductase [Amycolatopsis sp. NPDC059027]|uniref:LLM class flavin-dependent oxidoreductase n=1 Tax=Amycolatopsis sp. NPDC059027 TaxID=3346709 RepID=UPI00366B5A4F
MSTQEVVFGFGAHSEVADGPELVRMAQQADRERLDLISLSDHPFANVTNLPTRPAPVLARTVTSLSALSGGRVVLGMGAGGLWDRIAAMGVPRLSPADAVEAFEEALA